MLLLLPMMSLLIVCQCGLGAVSSSIGRKTVLAEIQANNARHQRIIATYGSVAVYMNRWYPRLTTFGLIQNHFANLDVTSLRSQTYMAIWLAPVWAWLTLAVLMLFQISMARAHIKVIHVLRCVLYSFDIPLWAVVITTGSLIILLSCQWLPRSYWPTGHPLGFAFGLFVNSITILFGLCIALGAYRLYMAYRWYLRFDRPLATVLATQFIALLCTVLVLELTAPQISYELYRFLGLLPH